MGHRTVVRRAVAAAARSTLPLFVVGLLASAGCTPSFAGLTTRGDRIVDRATGDTVQLIGFGLVGEFTPLEQLVAGPGMPDPNDLSARWALRWDGDALYGRIEVTDPVLRNRDGRPSHNDGVEIYLDPDDSKSLEYQPDDAMIRIIRDGPITAERGTMPAEFSATQQEVPGGYRVDFTLLLDEALPPGAFIGIDVRVTDNDGDRQEHAIGWAAKGEGAHRSPASLGTVRLRR